MPSTVLSKEPAAPTIVPPAAEFLHVPGWIVPLNAHLAARLANVALTSQVQIAYACATTAAQSAEKTAACIEESWPDTPMRSLVAQSFRSLAQVRERVARDILAQARRRCGLAFARLY